ncbi:lysylphosphatidylglycerol synthase transmembrane domain-containing protein [Thermomonospora umbrina]|uniref:lysylphosphatidylglycerol synthase transmembrane domain-containing protein n=1 Tax=Thermomonospora umbrina TaxID=111806 RepID=UPI001FE31A1F|nr:lysylphosphatidylglycerol synthase transmembrane domain-containing protein [Thermomonospora umbrina]
MALPLLAVGALVLLADELPPPGAVWRSATRAEPGWLIVLIVAAALSMAAFARLQHRLLSRGGLRISRCRTFAVTYASNALSTTLPAGAAISIVYTFQQFRRGGASAQLATAVIVLGGVVTTSAYAVVAVLALLAEPHFRVPAAVGVVVLAVPVVLGVALWRASRHAAWPRRVIAPPTRVIRAVLERPRLSPHVARLRELAGSLGLSKSAKAGPLRLSSYDWGALIVFALLNWLFDILALVAATRAVGVEVSPLGVALAYFAAQAAGSLIPVLPGGVGAIESAMAAALVALGAGLVPAGAAVALYRVVTHWGVVAVGWLAWLALRERPWHVPGLTRERVLHGFQAVGTGLAAAAGATYVTPGGTAAPRTVEPNRASRAPAGTA